MRRQSDGDRRWRRVTFVASGVWTLPRPARACGSVPPRGPAGTTHTLLARSFRARGTRTGPIVLIDRAGSDKQVGRDIQIHDNDVCRVDVWMHAEWGRASFCIESTRPIKHFWRQRQDAVKLPDS
jgi:hypothetical protein